MEMVNLIGTYFGVWCLESFCFSLFSFIETGEVVAETWGGKRRIDRILIRKDSPAQVIGYAFSSVLAGLTDHIPVALSLKLTNDS